ncbi:nucleotide exchange factor GrpE [Tunicatimonas pelagia]|uniref:nucleotide exchange factor GrpE n=1 Tax=Tunicatimonas pelagia TaxID=931531 RepID=UPI0026661AF5|nr:nucleotide exchange factor GrpE [Tunicatimonas pelagia]WKN43695.1 nucleotide exchange factor GrpE [Tunicatimonas pelagia]
MTDDKTTNEEIERDISEEETGEMEGSKNPFDEVEEKEEKPTEEEDPNIAVAEAKDKYLRLYAEFENYRRRTAKERLELIKTASEDIMSALIPVIDDFERSLDIFKENEAVAPMYEGIQLVHQKMVKILEQKGLTRMEVAQGSDFDSEYHEAVVQTPAPSEELKGKVVDVIESGYFIGEKVLRYAKVVIGS